MAPRGLRVAAKAVAVVFLCWEVGLVHAAPKIFPVTAPQGSRLSEAFEYDPGAGILLRKFKDGGGETRLLPMESFGRIPGLKADEIAIRVIEDFNSADPAASPLILVQHRYWFSVLDVLNDKAVVSNIGPFSAGKPGSPLLSAVLKLGDGGKLVLFSAEAVAVEGSYAGRPAKYLFFVDTGKKRTGWLAIRSDQDPIKTKILMAPPDELKKAGLPITDFLAIGGAFLEMQRGKVNDEGELIEPGMRPAQATLLIDLATGIVLDKAETKFLPKESEGQKKIPPRVVFTDQSKVNERFEVPGASAQQIEESGDSRDGAPKAAADRAVGKRLGAARGVREIVSEGLARLHGQSEAVEAFVRLGQKMRLGQKKFSVIVEAGPTGTGKTSGLRMFAQSLFPSDPTPLFRKSLAEATTRAFLQTELYGSTAGYVGSQDPSDLMLWLLNHPDGGVILFDEIDKTPPEVLNLLISFLDEGEVRMNAQLVEATLKRYAHVPVEQWPRALREAMGGNAGAPVAITLRLNENYVVALGTNMGAEVVNGSGSSNLGGRRLKTVEELRAANARITEEAVKAEMRRVGIKDEFINRVSEYVLFKVVMPEDHARIVRDNVADIVRHYKDTIRLDVTLTPELMAFLETETYSPLDGARYTLARLKSWISDHVSDAVLAKNGLGAGDRLSLDVRRGDSQTRSTLLLRGLFDEPLGEFPIGKPLRSRPTALLERARRMLMPTLEKRIVGHRGELKQVADSIISQLTSAVHDPDTQGRPVLLYLDGTPGSGKTEIAKAVAEALSDDPASLRRINMNEISHVSQFNSKFVAPLTSSIKTNPDSLVALLDELPRAGLRTGSAPAIQDLLLSILDEGELPPVEDEARVVNGLVMRSGEPTALPAGSVFIATGNLAVEALDAHSEFLTNKQLLATFRMLERYPEPIREVYAKHFDDAFRSRAGEPILVYPLADDEVAILRERFFNEAAKIPLAMGVTPVLSDSAKEFFEKQYVPIRGGRWVRGAMKRFIEVPLNALIGRDATKYQGATAELVYDDEKREMGVRFLRDGAEIETAMLAKVPRSKAEYHPYARAATAWKTAVHEAGHAIVRRALYPDPGSVAEINVFGGGEGGWMLPGVNVPSQNMYLTTQKGPYELAVGLGGHIAEVLFMPGGSGNGASSDFENVRKRAETMLINGSTLGIAPIPLITNPTTGQVELSERMRQRLEDHQAALMDFAARIAKHVIVSNQALLMDVAKALYSSEELSLSSEHFEEIVARRIASPSKKLLESMITANPATKHICASLLTEADAIPKPSGLKAWWGRFLSWFRFWKQA